jgi:predicted transcriptional regulator
MLKTDQINEIHRLAGGEHWSARRIARQLHLAPRAVKKYLATPVALPAHRPRASKLDVFKGSLQRTDYKAALGNFWLIESTTYVKRGSA